MRKTRTSRAAKETLVKVGRTGGRVEEYSLEGTQPTVEDALDAAGISTAKGDRIRLNSEIVDLDTIVADGDIITVAGKVTGGTK